MAAPVMYDRIGESSTTTGTGTLTLAGALTAFRAFSTVGNGSRCWYLIQAVNSFGNPTGDWEIGVGTYTSSGTTLSRTTVLASSNSNSLVSFGAGTKHVYLTRPADSMAEQAYWHGQCALLEPGCIEALNSGAFSYVVSAGTVKYIRASWQTRLASTGRLEIRDPGGPHPINGQTLTGTGADSAAVTLDTSLVTYDTPEALFYERINEVANAQTKYLAITAPSTYYPLLPGAYGIAIIHVTNYDFDWIIWEIQTFGLNLGNEINDGAAAAQRRDSSFSHLPLVLDVKSISEILSGTERSAGVGKGGVLYYHLPSTWSKITDGTTYDFRDDFMGASLDTATEWTRTESTAGNVEIDTAQQWCKLLGNGSWNANGLFSQDSIARADGKVFLVDVYVGRGGATRPNIIVGFHDGAGVDFTDFAHCLQFSDNAGSRAIFARENANSRGVVGSGWSDGCTYRVRLTLSGAGATYEIQGGTEYEPIGSASWDNITPGTSSSPTNTLHAGATINAAVTTYISHPRIY